MMTLSASSRAFAMAALLVAAAGCDFTPTLDIETPEYESGLVLRSILSADSVATVRVGTSWDPYGGRPDNATRGATALAVVTLLRDSQPIEVLTLRDEQCPDYRQPPDPVTGEQPTYACGAYVGTVPVQAGATYTVRAQADGQPVAEATVTVPLRPVVDITEETAAADPDRRFRISLSDPAGQGDRYGLTLYQYITTGRGTICENGVCRDTTYTISNPDFFAFQFDTSDPVILSSAGEISGSGVSFASFTDETFDGRTKSFTITPGSNYRREEQNGAMKVQLATLSDDLYAAYRISYFSGGGDNPFAEPINLPSNVTGGYGLVGAVALVEVAFPARESQP